MSAHILTCPHADTFTHHLSSIDAPPWASNLRGCASFTTDTSCSPCATLWRIACQSLKEGLTGQCGYMSIWRTRRRRGRVDVEDASIQKAHGCKRHVGMYRQSIGEHPPACSASSACETLICVGALRCKAASMHQCVNTHEYTQ
jgi:hypothetical protein